MHVDRGWLEEGITLGQSAVSDESSVRSQSDEPVHQGDKVHRTVRRLLYVIRATGAARDEQLGEHKAFLEASRWENSRAATGRGAGYARCPLTTRHTARTQRGEPPILTWQPKRPQSKPVTKSPESTTFENRDMHKQRAKTFWRAPA